MTTLWKLCIFLGLSYSASGLCPLSRQIEAFDTDRQGRLASIVKLGRKCGIAFGIESASNLAGMPPSRIAAGNVASVIHSILGARTKYSASCYDGVVLIRDLEETTPRWLDRRVTEFRIPSTTLGMANAGLLMRVVNLLDPKQQGFAGSIPDSANDRVGPEEMVNQPVRSILCKLVSRAGSAMWVSWTVVKLDGVTMWPSDLWTMIHY